MVTQGAFVGDLHATAWSAARASVAGGAASMPGAGPKSRSWPWLC